MRGNDDQPRSGRADRPVQPPRRRPQEHQHADGNTSAKTTETDPVTGDPVDLLWVKGSGRRPRHPRGSDLAVLRLDRIRALVDVYPGIERGRVVAAFDYCLHGKGGAGSVDRHRDARPRRRCPRRPPPPGLPASRSRPPTTKALTRRSSATRSSGCHGAARIPARSRHRRDQGRQPARRSAASSAAMGSLHGQHQRGGRGQFSLDHRQCSRYRSPELQGRAVRPAARGYAALPPTSAGPRPPRSPHDPRHRRRQPPDRRPLTDTRRGARLPRPRRAPQLAARHLLPRPLPAQGQAARARPAVERLVEESLARAAELAPPTATTTRPTTTGTRRPTRPRSAGRTH